MFNGTLTIKPEVNELQYTRQKRLFNDFVIQKPFLKWAGGKTQMINDLMKFTPKNFNKYIEPFIGGGALFFSLNHRNSIISDSNEELILTYKQVKVNVYEVISILEKYINTEEFYYKIRALNLNMLSNSERAARFIYLNKTCFNGLYRVNKKGEFNVPYCKKQGTFLNKENLLSASEYMQNTEIFHSDYKQILLDYAEKGDFIFLDPPYQPIGKYADFKRYTKELFYENDHIDLANIFKDLINKGCFVMLTNSDHPTILELYKDYHIEKVATKNHIFFSFSLN